MQIIDIDRCTGCGACMNICPKFAITMHESIEGFIVPVVNDANCIECHLCRKSCPVICPPLISEIREAFAAYSKDDVMRRMASSGGVFGMLAGRCLDDGGTVFGVGWQEKCDGVHSIAINNRDQLASILGSKYIQSTTGTTFNAVRNLLTKGERVVYSGTPCQVAGLKGYLGRDYDNLITVDLICHGCPSPAIWRSYLKEKRSEYGVEVKNVWFRDKSDGWDQYKIRIRFSDDTEYSMPASKDVYMNGFLRNFFLRRSCYKCPYKSTASCSDITLADFWGIEKYHPNMNRNMGVSAVMLHTMKGQLAFNSIKDSLCIVPCTVLEIINGNPSLIQSASLEKSRELFFRRFSRGESVSKIIEEMTQMRICKKLLTWIKRRINKCKHI